MNRRQFLSTTLALPFAGACAAGPPGAAPALPLEHLGASTACLAGLPLLGALDALDEMGFDTVELIAYTGARHSVGAIPGYDHYAATEAERERVYDATRAFRHISAHMPFQDMHLFSSDAAVRRAGLDRVRRAMDGLAFLEGSLAVVHPGWPGEGRSFRDIWTPMVETFRALGDYAGERGLRIGLETMQPDSVRDYTELIFDVDHPAVGATIDTGHIRGSEDIGLPPERRASEEARARFNDVLEEVVGILGDKVLHYHLSDVRNPDWRDHHTVGTGIIDFPRLFRRLRRTGYDGLLVFELEEQDTTGALAASKRYVETLMTA